MSGVHATEAGGAEAPNPTTRFLDTLYDIIATGVEPGGGVALSEIEAFVHEHARTPKSLTDFQVFFAQHGLTTRSDHPETGVPRILEPLPAVEPPPPALGAPAVPDEEDGDDDEGVTRPGTLAAMGTRGVHPGPALLVACAVLLLIVGGTAAHMIVTLAEMRSELAQAQVQSVNNHQAIERLGTETDHIRGGLFDTGDAMRRVEEKSDLLLETLLPAPLERP